MAEEEQRRVLLGLHDNGILKMYDMLAKQKGLHPVSMPEREALSGELRGTEYDFCIIDPNLGNPGARDISFARAVRDCIRSKGHDTNLYVMTGRKDSYLDLVDEGFRAGLKAHSPIMEPFGGI